jgi:tRNA (guanine37-N1)-methyltransferase
MKFDVVTIFPEFFAGPFHYGIVRRAREAGLIDIRVHDLRQFTHDRHKTVDDRPFGGGEGMVFKPEPMFEAVETILSDAAPCNPEAGDSPKPPDSTAVVLLSASGKVFVQEMAERFAALERMVLLCGRYEGVDERVAEHLATDEVSIGDFVLSGGELAAAMVIDAVTRLLPGALGNEASSLHESFSSSSSSSSSSLPPSRSPAAESDRHRTQVESEIPHGHFSDPSHDGARATLDYPHYTRPADFRGHRVPEVLLSGNHEEIRRWRERVALEKTRRNRPDLLTPTK